MAAIKRAQAAWWLAEEAAGVREGPQGPEDVGGTGARQGAGGVLDPSAANYTLVVRGSPALGSGVTGQTAPRGGPPPAYEALEGHRQRTGAMGAANPLPL